MKLGAVRLNCQSVRQQHQHRWLGGRERRSVDARKGGATQNSVFASERIECVDRRAMGEIIADAAANPHIIMSSAVVKTTLVKGGWPCGTLN